VSTPIDTLIARARAAADDTSPGSVSPTADRLKLQRLASEFESMLLNQMLSEMRKAGRWQDEDEEEDMFGAKALFETLDAEFTKELSQARGFGLGRQLMTAFDRMQGNATPDATKAGAPTNDTKTKESSGADAVTPVGTTGVGDAAPATIDPIAVARQILDGDAVSSGGNAKVTSGFGWRRDPFTGEARFHKGIDLQAAYGQDVAAVAGGTVTFSGTQGSYGTTVVVQHANGTQSRYAHLSLALVAAGDPVSVGQVVGRAGSSGRATGPHVHLEVLDREGRALNPLTHPEGTTPSTALGAVGKR
jgi:murein DD-endopeptidase MepM/ murein hydrolase activator NlpD